MKASYANGLMVNRILRQRHVLRVRWDSSRSGSSRIRSDLGAALELAGRTDGALDQILNDIGQALCAVAQLLSKASVSSPDMSGFHWTIPPSVTYLAGRKTFEQRGGILCRQRNGNARRQLDDLGGAFDDAFEAACLEAAGLSDSS